MEREKREREVCLFCKKRKAVFFIALTPYCVIPLCRKCRESELSRDVKEWAQRWGEREVRV